MFLFTNISAVGIKIDNAYWFISNYPLNYSYACVRYFQQNKICKKRCTSSSFRLEKSE